MMSSPFCACKILVERPFTSIWQMLACRFNNEGRWFLHSIHHGRACRVPSARNLPLPHAIHVSCLFFPSSFILAAGAGGAHGSVALPRLFPLSISLTSLELYAGLTFDDDGIRAVRELQPIRLPHCL